MEETESYHTTDPAVIAVMSVLRRNTGGGTCVSQGPSFEEVTSEGDMGVSWVENWRRANSKAPGGRGHGGPCGWSMEHSKQEEMSPWREAGRRVEGRGQPRQGPAVRDKVSEFLLRAIGSRRTQSLVQESTVIGFGFKKINQAATWRRLGVEAETRWELPETEQAGGDAGWAQDGGSGLGFR